MGIKFNPQNLEKSHEKFLFAVDVVMLLLVIFNLNWVVFDTLFTSHLLQDFLMSIIPSATIYYKEVIHPNFPVYDMVFVAIFLVELLCRWVIAIVRNTYHRWFFYPFIHWYDVLGCVPITSFRGLRLLRVFSVFYRLQKYQIFDFSKTYPYRSFEKYRAIIVEEISDRVVINVLNDVQNEIRTGNPVVGKITDQVIVPQKQVLIDWLIERINDLDDTVYKPRREEFRRYVDKTIANSLAEAPKLKLLEKVPVLGDTITEIVESTVSTVVFNVVDKLISDLANEDTDALVNELADLLISNFTQSTGQLNDATRNMIIESIDVIKEDVQIQQWKIREQEELAKKRAQKST